MNLLQNPSSPTSVDYAVVRKVLSKSKDYVREGHCNKFLNEKDRDKFLALTPPPVTSLDAANYGSATLELRVLCHYTNVHLFIIDPLKRDSPSWTASAGYLSPTDVNPFITYLSGSRQARMSHLSLKNFLAKLLDIRNNVVEFEDGEAPIVIETNGASGERDELNNSSSRPNLNLGTSVQCAYPPSLPRNARPFHRLLACRESTATTS